MLIAENICLTKNGKKILDHVSIVAKSGELTSILGPNGAGKSSLFKVLAGLDNKYEGLVNIKSIDINHLKATALARTRAILSQKMPITMPFTVEEVVMMGRYPYQKECSLQNNKAIVHHVCEQAGVSHLLERAYQSLSGGEQQRVHWARVLAQLIESKESVKNSSKILFLDEPISNLDIQYQLQMLQAAQGYAKRYGWTVIAILHDLNIAAKFSDRMYLLKNGAVIAGGLTKNVCTAKHLSETFNIAITVRNADERIAIDAFESHYEILANI